MKILRVFRLVRVARLLRARGGRLIGRSLLRNRAGSALLSLLLMGILVLEFGSLWMLALEQYAPDANITTASDALWYAIVTISTVGYGDQYPVTNEGRILGVGHHRRSASASSARSPATWPTSSSRRSRRRRRSRCSRPASGWRTCAPCSPSSRRPSTSSTACSADELPEPGA